MTTKNMKSTDTHEHKIYITTSLTFILKATKYNSVA